MNYDELIDWIKNEMQMFDGKNYQPVMIRMLNQNDGKATKRQIQRELNKENPGLPASFFDKLPFDVLTKHGIVELKDGHYELVAYNTYREKSGKINEITFQCNQKIGGDVRNELQQLIEKGISERVYKALLWYWKKRGVTYTRDQLAKPKRDGFIDPDDLLESDQRVHGMVKGTYKAKDEEFAQAIMLNPDSKWKMELKTEYPSIRIDYDYKDTNPDQVAWMEKSFTNNVPLGVVFCVGKNKWKVLGLCRVTEKISDTCYRLESWGITDEASTKLKNDALQDYDRYHTSKELKNFEPIRWNEINSKLRKVIENPEATTHAYNKKIKNILYEVEEGNWALPDFQRLYKWKPKDVTKLLNSIFFGRYIGSLLFWNVEDEEGDEMGIEAIEGSDGKIDEYKRIILDGQQRITSINYAIKAPDKTPQTRNHPGYFYINCKGFLQDDDDELIINTKKKLDEKDTFDRLLFPLYYLEDKESWFSDLRKFLELQNKWEENFGSQIIDKIRKKVGDIEDFEIPCIDLERMSYNQVSITFETINTTGAVLDVFDLMVNRMAGYKIKLKDMWKSVEKEEPLIKKYNDKMKTDIARYILESISLSHTPLKSTKKPDILDMFKKMKKDQNWTKEKFEQYWQDTTKNVVRAITFLEDKQKGFGVPSPDFLPYEPILPVLTSLIQQSKTEEFKEKAFECEQKIRQWYWACVFRERYNQGVESKKKEDYLETLEWFRNDSSIPKVVASFREKYQEIAFEDVRSARSAIYRGVMCLIMKKGAEDPMLRFEPDRKKHMDHIYPKAKITKGIKNSILNMTWLTDITNISKSDTMPDEYYGRIKKQIFKNDEKIFQKALSSHLIGKESAKYLLEENFEEFIESRRKDILQEIAKENGLEYKGEDDFIPTQTSPETKYDNILVLRNAVRSCNEEIFWISKYFSEADLETLRKGMSDKVKKIRILSSRKRKDVKSEFKRFKDQFSKIDCQMRIMSKEVESGIHGRYLTDEEKCYNMIDTEIAARGQTDDISLCKKPESLEEWWNNSHDIFTDWNKFQDTN
tara:strand:+ start:161 stop:3277 length:3117 start_codon:yes stop_codon:yes gene_type:complete